MRVFVLLFLFDITFMSSVVCALTYQLHTDVLGEYAANFDKVMRSHSWTLAASYEKMSILLVYFISWYFWFGALSEIVDILLYTVHRNVFFEIGMVLIIWRGVGSTGVASFCCERVSLEAAHGCWKRSGLLRSCFGQYSSLNVVSLEAPKWARHVGFVCGSNRL